MAHPASGEVYALANKISWKFNPEPSRSDIQLQTVIRKSSDHGKSWSSESVVRDENGMDFKGLRPSFFTVGKNHSPGLLAPKFTALPAPPSNPSFSQWSNWIRSIDTLAYQPDMEVTSITLEPNSNVWKQFSASVSKSDFGSKLNKGSWEWSSCSGRSIQLKRKPDTGRQLIPVFWKNTVVLESGLISEKFYSGSIYSLGNHEGSLWKTGKPVGPGNAECHFVELADRLILMHAMARPLSENAETHRRLAASPSQGTDWVGPNNDQDLPEIQRAGSWMRFSRIAEGARMNRTMMTQVVNESSFTGLVLKMSYEEGMTWSYTHPIYSGWVDRSEMVDLNQQSVGVLYENGSRNFPWESISFQQIKLSEITQGNDTQW